jgi:hypothetical protein
MEADEMGEFAKQMREAGEADEAKSRSSMMRVSLLISVLAVLVAMVTVMGHREHTEAVLMQARAADQWNEYQARKMRVQQVGLAQDMLSLQPNSNQAAVTAKLAAYKAELGKWQAELTPDAEKAQEFEAEVAIAEQKAAHYDLGEALLEIAVVLASITLLTRHQHYAIVALVLGVAGLIIAGSALLLR